MSDTKDLEKTLWATADKMRNNMDAAEYKHVVLGLIFLKYISDSFEELHQKLKNDSLSDPEDKDEYLAENVFFVPQQARWSYLQHQRAKLPSIGKDLDDAMDAIEKENPNLKGVLPKDGKIELNNEINKNLEALAQALFKHWFVDFEFPDENGQPYKSSGGEMVESELGLIPKGWRVKKISEISNLKIGRTPPRKEHQWFSTNNDDIKWVSIKDMGISGVYITETSEFLTEEAVAKFNIPVIHPNTVILSFKLTIGRLAITTERMLSNEAIAHINLNTSDFYPEFIYLYLKLFNYESLGSTSSIATAVNSKSILSIPVILPDIKMLERFKAAICCIL